jgi:hypothetical protein
MTGLVRLIAKWDEYVLLYHDFFLLVHVEDECQLLLQGSVNSTMVYI